MSIPSSLSLTLGPLEESCSLIRQDCYLPCNCLPNCWFFKNCVEFLFNMPYLCMCVLSRFSNVQIFATRWTTVHQAPLCSWDFPGENTGVGCLFLLHGIFLTHGSNPHLLHWQVGSLPMSLLQIPCLLVGSLLQ